MMYVGNATVLNKITNKICPNIFLGAGVAASIISLWAVIVCIICF